MGRTRSILDLTPQDFERFRQKLSKHGLNSKGSGLGVHALSRSITVIKAMLLYAYDMDLIDRPTKYGKAFNKPSATVKRKSRIAAEQANGRRVFSPTQIQTLLKEADNPLHAMILLAVNGGFGNSDCARLSLSAIDWERALIDFPRPKTAIARIVPMWPETHQALRKAIAARPKPADEDAAKLVFVTRFGQPWVREKVHREPDGTIKKVVPTDAIGPEFDKLIRRLGFKRRGLGFYTLRHVFRTWADEVKDPHAIFRIMGHAIPGMSGVYVEEIGLARLKAVVDHVREHLSEVNPNSD